MSVPKFLANRGVFKLLQIDMPMEGALIDRGAGMKELCIDKNLAPIGKLVSFLHELIHLIEPDFSEDEVMADEGILLGFLGIPEVDTTERKEVSDDA